MYVPMDYYTREPRGFAYVQYPCLFIGIGLSLTYKISLLIFVVFVHAVTKGKVLKTDKVLKTKC